MAKKDKKQVKNNKDKTSFMKSFRAELKKVIWPTPKQLFNNTIAVLAIVLITALIVFVLDLAFESMNKYGIDKVKEVVVNSVDNEVIDSEAETSGDETLDESEETETTDVDELNSDATTENNDVAENTNSEQE